MSHAQPLPRSLVSRWSDPCLGIGVIIRARHVVYLRAARHGWARLALLKTFDKVSLITRVFANECPLAANTRIMSVFYNKLKYNILYLYCIFLHPKKCHTVCHCYLFVWRLGLHRAPINNPSRCLYDLKAQPLDTHRVVLPK